MVSVPWQNVDDLAVVLFLGGLGIGILRADPRVRANQLLATFLFLVAANYGASFLADLTTNPAADALWARVGLISGVLDPFVLLWFASIFPNPRGRFLAPWMFRLAMAETLCLALIPLAVPGEFALCCSSDPGHFRFLTRVLLAAHVTLYYGAALVLLWTSHLRERSEIMSSQLRLLAIGASIPILTRFALLPEDAGWPPLPAHPKEVWIRLLLLAAIYIVARLWYLRAEDPGRRRAGRGAWNTVAILLLFVALIWTLNVVVTEYWSPHPTFAATTNWSFSVRWLIFGLYCGLGFVRLGALDADPHVLRTSVAFVISAAGAVGVAVASLIGGPAWAGLAAIGVLFLAVSVMGPSTSRAVPSSGAPVNSLPDVGPGTTNLRFGGGADPGLIAGRYRLISAVGRGATGRSFLGRDEQEGNLVVLKRLDVGPHVELVEREVRVAKRVSHPNLAAVHGLVRQGTDVYLVQEYVEGGDLAQSLRTARLSRQDRARIADGMLDGLEALHAAGIIHGDIKPANILLDASNRALVADFGLARVGRSRTGGVEGGTPRYVAPEIQRGERPSLASDVFSAGVVLRELYAGRSGRPGRGKRFGAGLSKAAASTLARALEPDVRARFRNAGELRKEWRAVTGARRD